MFQCIQHALRVGVWRLVLAVPRRFGQAEPRERFPVARAVFLGEFDAQLPYVLKRMFRPGDGIADAAENAGRGRNCTEEVVPSAGRDCSSSGSSEGERGDVEEGVGVSRDGFASPEKSSGDRRSSGDPARKGLSSRAAAESASATADRTASATSNSLRNRTSRFAGCTLMSTRAGSRVRKSTAG